MSTPPDPRRRDEVRSALDRLLELISGRVAEQVAAERSSRNHQVTEPDSNPIDRKPNTEPEGK
jgi:hypothetical protein